MRIVGKVGLTVGLLVLLNAGPALAQSTYVGAAVVGDILRNSHTESAGQDFPEGGETVGFGLRVGTSLGSRWGIELEFTRPGEIETEFPALIPLTSRTDTVVTQLLPTSPTQPAVFTSLPILQSVSYRQIVRQRHSTLATTAWLNQSVGGRITLRYLAGMAFFRETNESEFRFEGLPPITIPPITIPPRTTVAVARTVIYGIRPLAGFEVRLRLTDHINVVPGVRLHGLDNAWLTRPAVGIEWQF